VDMDGSEVLNGVPVSELIEARERTDAGVRLAMPQLAEQLGVAAPASPAEAPAEIGEEEAGAVGRALDGAREKVQEAGVALPLEGHIDLHLRFNAVINEIDRIGAILAERKK